jgi:hypothetical protein
VTERISFEEAISEPQLLKTRFNELSFPQQVALKLMYGVELTARRTDPATGFTELDLWAIFHGACRRDHLGFVTEIRLEDAPPYVPKEYREAWLIVGRRAGKTDAFAATIVGYEATCGGHERYLRPRQQGICFQIAQDLRMARNSLHFVRAVLESSPLLEREIVQITADRIDLKNRFTIACVPATLKSVRGFASPVSVLDEVGVWYQEAESANPDYEIYRALSPGQVQFPDRKIVGISTPWNKAGLLYQYAEAGTEGYKLHHDAAREQYRDALVLTGATPVMGNPLVTRDFLVRERDRDERAFEREILAEFQDSISGFIPTILVEQARDDAVYERRYDPKWTYHPAIDPAFRRDAFAFTIVHNEGGTVIQDVVRRFIARQGEVLDPVQVLDQIVPLLLEFRSSIVYSDQYQLESLGQLLRMRGIEIVPVTFTAKSKAQLYGNLQQLFLQRKIRVLDDPETLRELKSLERTLTGGGTVQISAPQGLHDDMASVLAIAAAQAMWDGDGKSQDATGTERELSVHERIQEQIQRKWAGLESLSAWD